MNPWNNQADDRLNQHLHGLLLVIFHLWLSRISYVVFNLSILSFSF